VVQVCLLRRRVDGSAPASCRVDCVYESVEERIDINTKTVSVVPIAKRARNVAAMWSRL